MKLSHQDYEHISVLTISGDYTVDDLEQFMRSDSERRKVGVRHVLLNCEDLDFVDSAGLESWLRIQEELGLEGGQFRLINPDEIIRKILELTRLELAFDSHPTVEEAVRSLR